MNPLTQVITVAEAVELSGLNVRMVQRYCKSGKFQARQDYKGNWLILKSSLQTKEESKMKIVSRKEVIRVEYEQDENFYDSKSFFWDQGYRKVETGISHGIQFAIWEKEIESST